MKYPIFDGEATIRVNILLKTFAHAGLKLSVTEQLSLSDNITQVAVSQSAQWLPVEKRHSIFPVSLTISIFLARQKTSKSIWWYLL